MSLTPLFNDNHSGIRFLAHTQNFAIEPIHVWAKVLKSEQLKLQVTVNNKKVLVLLFKNYSEISNFQKWHKSEQLKLQVTISK